MGIFDDIKLGLEQAIEYEKGNLKAKKTTLSIQPLESFTSTEIHYTIASAESKYKNQNHHLKWWYAPALQGHITGRA